MAPTAVPPKRQWLVRSAGLALGLATIVGLAACVAGPEGGSPSTTRPPAESSQPTRTATSTPASPAPTVTSSAQPATSPSESPGVPLPPRAVLTAPNGSSVDGDPGSYLVGSFGNDSPWHPARGLQPITVEPRGPLQIRFPDDPTVLVSSSSAEVAASTDQQGAHTAGVGQSPDGAPPTAVVDLTGPAAGDWVLLVDLHFANGDAAAYFWRIKAR